MNDVDNNSRKRDVAWFILQLAVGYVRVYLQQRKNKDQKG